MPAEYSIFRLLLAKTGSRCVKLSLEVRPACRVVAPSLELQRARSFFFATLQLGLTLGDLDEKREHLPGLFVLFVEGFFLKKEKKCIFFILIYKSSL